MIYPDSPRQVVSHKLSETQVSTETPAASPDLSAATLLGSSGTTQSGLPHPLLDHHAVDLTHTESPPASASSSEDLLTSSSREVSPRVETRSISMEDPPILIPAIVTHWEETKPAHSTSPSTSSSAASSRAVSPEIDLSKISHIRNEMKITLHNQMIQTKIEISALKQFSNNNPNLSEDDRRLLGEYIGRLEQMAAFDERASLIIDDIEARNGPLEEMIDAYNHIWGSQDYADYTQHVKAILDLSPKLGELLQNKEKFPVIFRDFRQFVTTQSRKRKNELRELKKQLIHNNDIHDSILESRKDGSMYMQWLTRIAMQMKTLSEEVNDQSARGEMLSTLLRNCDAQVNSINTLRQIEGIVQDLPMITGVLEEAQRSRVFPETLEEVRLEKIDIRKKILLMREKISPLKLLEENRDISSSSEIPSTLSSANLEQSIRDMQNWLHYIESEIEPQIKEEELLRIQNLGLQQRNRMSLNDLNYSVDLIKKYQSQEMTISEPMIKKLSPRALESQRLDLVRLQLLFIQQFSEEEIRSLNRNDRQRYAQLIDEVIDNIKPYQSIIPGRRKISRTQLRRVLNLLG